MFNPMTAEKDREHDLCDLALLTFLARGGKVTTLRASRAPVCVPMPREQPGVYELLKLAAALIAARRA